MTKKKAELNPQALAIAVLVRLQTARYSLACAIETTPDAALAGRLHILATAIDAEMLGIKRDWQAGGLVQ